MLEIVVTVMVPVVSAVAVPAFGYLKYRSYTSTIRHLVDELGVEGLKRAKTINPPTSTTIQLPRRSSTSP